MTYKGTKPGGLRRFPPKIFCFNIWTLPRQNLLTVPSPLYWALQKTSQNYQSNPKPKCSGWDTKNADRLGHRDTKNENNLGHRDTENADKMLGHRDTKNADRLGHRDIKNVEKIGFGFLRLENQVYWFLSQNSWTCVDRQTQNSWTCVDRQTQNSWTIWDTGTLKMQTEKNG